MSENPNCNQVKDVFYMCFLRSENTDNYWQTCVYYYVLSVNFI